MKRRAPSLAETKRGQVGSEVSWLRDFESSRKRGKDCEMDRQQENARYTNIDKWPRMHRRFWYVLVPSNDVKEFPSQDLPPTASIYDTLSLHGVYKYVSAIQICLPLAWMVWCSKDEICPLWFRLQQKSKLTCFELSHLVLEKCTPP